MKNSSAKDLNPQEDRHDYIKNKCAIIYGSLPPKTKKEQANLFNKGLNGIKYLIATDAIAMGLNLNIKRIIFSEVQKVSEEGLKKLTLLKFDKFPEEQAEIKIMAV